jgi:hypothetical protein
LGLNQGRSRLWNWLTFESKKVWFLIPFKVKLPGKNEGFGRDMGRNEMLATVESR